MGDDRSEVLPVYCALKSNILKSSMGGPHYIFYAIRVFQIFVVAVVVFFKGQYFYHFGKSYLKAP